MDHKLKILPKYFVQILIGTKTFELRRDRGFEVGDILILKEWDDEEEVFTGREIKKIVTYISRNVPHYGLMNGYVILGIK